MSKTLLRLGRRMCKNEIAYVSSTTFVVDDFSSFVESNFHSPENDWQALYRIRDQRRRVRLGRQQPGNGAFAFSLAASSGA
jgi:hypothetical protein